jgi:hypothetical protein
MKAQLEKLVTMPLSHVEGDLKTLSVLIKQ